MYLLFKKDSQLYRWTMYVGFIGFLLVTYLVTLPPSAFYLLSVFVITFSLYSYDDKVQVNRFLISLPVERRTIVKSRYLYSVLVAIGMMCIQLIFMFGINLFFTTDLYRYTWQDSVALLGFACIMIALFTPFIYFLKKLSNAMFAMLFLIGVGTIVLLNELERVLPSSDIVVFNDINAGFALIVEAYFPRFSYVIFILLTSILLYSSLLLSRSFFKKKDI